MKKNKKKQETNNEHIKSARIGQSKRTEEMKEMVRSVTRRITFVIAYMTRKGSITEIGNGTSRMTVCYN